MILFACCRPHRPVRARFHGLFSVTGNHSNVKFSAFFQCFFAACARCLHVDVANVLRLSLETIFGTYVTHVQTCDVTRVQSVTEWTASVHTSRMHCAAH